MITEDKVRDKARNILGLNESLKGAKADVGQLTTFNQLGFPGISDKPDGWYLRERQKFCVHGIIGARQTGASNEHEHQTQFS